MKNPFDTSPDFAATPTSDNPFLRASPESLSNKMKNPLATSPETAASSIPSNPFRRASPESLYRKMKNPFATYPEPAASTSINPFLRTDAFFSTNGTFVPTEARPATPSPDVEMESSQTTDVEMVDCSSMTKRKLEIQYKRHVRRKLNEFNDFVWSVTYHNFGY